MKKVLLKTTLIVYLLVLLWLVLFKFSFDIVSVLSQHPAKGFNVIPFAGSSEGGTTEMLGNLLVFIPFGLLLGANFKQTTLRQKLACVFAFSAAVEALQYVLAIGVTDITDIITNTLGGLIGLVLYGFAGKFFDTEKIDRAVITIGLVLFALFFYLRVFVFKVRY